MAGIGAWTFVVSEYLDLPFLLRKEGALVVSARTAKEALDYLSRFAPGRIIVDHACCGAQEVIRYASQRCPDAVIESHADVITRLLADRCTPPGQMEPGL